MISNETMNKDFWKAIELHYEKECYTDALKDACLYIIELVQEKSDMDDLDGEKLINNVFSEKTPKLLINNNETETEKDEQRGFYYLLRGIICAIRNPISHKKDFKFSKVETDGILLFINNYIIPKLDDSKDFSYIDDWFKFIFIDNDNDNEKYSDTLLDNIPKKERLNLMFKIVENIGKIQERKYKYFINKLFNKLTIKDQKEIIILLNKKLIKLKDNKELRMFFAHFNPNIWTKLDTIVRVRIEYMVYNSIKSGKTYYDPFSCQIEFTGELGILSVDWISFFSNKNEIINLLFDKMGKSEQAEYISNFFFTIMIDKGILNKYSSKIKAELNQGNIYFKKLLDYYKLFNKKDEVFLSFKKEYDSFETPNNYEEVPF